MLDALATLLPIVLVGGRSSRFGRDKLREPLASGTWLVDRPIAALRAVFGARVALVGACDPAVAARGDFVLHDSHPGVGPAGGILSALTALSNMNAVFVLPGDLPAVSADVIRTILQAAIARPDATAILAYTDRIEPCVGVYRADAVRDLAEFVLHHRGRLAEAIPPERRCLVSISAPLLANANTPSDLKCTP